MTQRRDFIRQASFLAAGSVAATAATGSLLAQAVPAPATQAQWDMSWAARVTGQQRMVFDSPEVADGIALHQVRSFIQGYRDTLGLTDADVSAVLVIRHAAMSMVLDDALWADGAFGEANKLKDPVSGEVAKRNPFIRIPADARHSLAWPDGALDTLMSRGVIVLACELALRNFGGQIAGRMKIPRQDAHDLVSKHLLPGVIRMPSGVFATCHAQSLGCGVLQSGG